jgi:hypothetical protein
MSYEGTTSMGRTVTIPLGWLIAALVVLALGAGLAYNWMQREIDEARLAAARADPALERAIEQNQRELVGMVARRELPPESLRAIAPNGNLDFFSIVGPRHCPPTRSCRHQVVTRWDMNGDGKLEKVTEADIEHRYAIRAP